MPECRSQLHPVGTARLTKVAIPGLPGHLMCILATGDLVGAVGTLAAHLCSRIVGAEIPQGSACTSSSCLPSSATVAETEKTHAPSIG